MREHGAELLEDRRTCDDFLRERNVDARQRSMAHELPELELECHRHDVHQLHIALLLARDCYSPVMAEESTTRTPRAARILYYSRPRS